MTSEFNDEDVVTGIDVSEDSKKGKVALGISTNSSGNIMLHATLLTKTGYQINLISHIHNHCYPQFFIGPSSICTFPIFQTKFNCKCNRLWS